LKPWLNNKTKIRGFARVLDDPEWIEIIENLALNNFGVNSPLAVKKAVEQV
jgi:hypothetical protein